MKVLSTLCAMMLATPAIADEVADFYKSKTFTIVVGHEVGTGFDIYGRTLQRHLGRYIPGYQGSASVKVAIQRGEVHGICGLPMSTITSFWRDEYQAGTFTPIIQLSGSKQAELKDIPHVDDYAKTEDDRKVFGLIFGTQALGRIYLSPPAMPAARKALLDTMKDPEFIADAAKTQIDI